MSGYIGPIPVPQGIQNKETFTATAGQTTFNTNGYTDGAFISIYLNGVRLINGTDYTATNGSDVVLASAAAASDVVDFESLNSFSLSNSTFTGDVTVGDDLLLNSDSAVLSIGADADLKITHDGTNGDFESAGNLTFDVAGDITLDADGADVILKDDGTQFGQLYKNGNDFRIESNVSDGNLVFTGNDGGSGVVALTLDMSDAGTATFNHDIRLGDSSKAVFGAGNDLQIFHDGTNSFVQDAAAGDLILDTNGDSVKITHTDNGETMAQFQKNGFVKLFHNNSLKLETTSGGATITGLTTTDNMLIANSDSVMTGFSGQLLTLDGTGGSNTGDAGVLMKTPTNSRGFVMDNSGGNEFRIFGGNGFPHASDFRISNVGNVTIGGSLSKGSGSFKIRHPLDAKKDTHWLVHSFVEGPQADNIYRGKVALVDGTATQNIDTVSGMTEGTFDALNREVQCFTTNETGWTAIKGSVSGNVLTITAQVNTCTDTISWMVIGERKDEHMMSKHTKWTDSDGKIIIEPELTDTEKEDKTEYLEGVGE